MLVAEEIGVFNRDILYIPRKELNVTPGIYNTTIFVMYTVWDYVFCDEVAYNGVEFLVNL